MKKILFTILTLFICTNVFAISVKEYIKVGILSGNKPITIGCDQKYYFVSGDKQVVLSAGKVTVNPETNTAVIADKRYKLPIKFISSKNCLLVNDKIYRGNIIVNCAGNKINIINELKFEDYLKGILPKEASSSWNTEALKTQAVISRTYAAKNVGKHAKDGFDVCSTVHCQVYGGASCENKKCNLAVHDTKGEVVLYKGELAQTLFHAACGGHTDDPKYVWGWKQETPSYLKGRKDKYCKNNPHSSWTTEVDESFIRQKLIAAGYKVGTVKKISYSGKTTGKAAKIVTISSSKGKLKLNAYTFRLAVDPFKIKSTMFTSIKCKNKKFIFSGKGWGHKVGLCQWGAKAMGDKKLSYKKILDYYYPGTNIGKINYGK
ncbi:MAG: SpoIID/LytB domain-containing protein [Elusimicrobia bacterium]|nr:SpoIID/LytB domain-containing protein [Elusimicrobiota bacterium]